jgi:hypothetical protein
MSGCDPYAKRRVTRSRPPRLRESSAGCRGRLGPFVRQPHPGAAREEGRHAPPRRAEPGQVGCGGADVRRAGLGRAGVLAKAGVSGDRGGVRAKNFADAFSVLGRLPSRLEVAPVFPRESAREAPPLFSRAARLVCGVPWLGLHLVQRPAGEVIPADKSRLGPYAVDGILGLVGLAFNRHGGPRSELHDVAARTPCGPGPAGRAAARSGWCDGMRASDGDVPCSSGDDDG